MVCGSLSITGPNTDLSPSTATTVVPYSPPDAAADSLVPATQALGIIILYTCTSLVSRQSSEMFSTVP